MKKFLLLSVCAIGMAAVAGCSNGEKATEESKAEGNYTIDIVAKGFQHQFWKSVESGAKDAAQEYGATINFVGPANETAIQEQVQMLNNAVNKKPDAIVLASLDTESQVDLLKQAQSEGIPIIGFDSGVPGAPEGSIVGNASTDNKNAASVGADKLFEQLADEVKNAKVGSAVRIGVVSQEVNSQSITDRTSGFIEQFAKLSEEQGATVSIVGHSKFANKVAEKDASVILDLQVPAQITDAAAQTAAQTLLNKTDIIGIFGTNEFAAKGIINANNAVGKPVGDKIVGAGFDSGTLQKDAVSSKVFIGSVTQDPVQIGFKAVELAVKAIKGESVSDVDTGAVWYDSENIDSDEVAPLLYD